MFKDAKAFANKIVDNVSEPIQTFDGIIKDDPEMIIPLAVIHLVPVALSIAGAVVIIRGHQQLKIEKERTKQVKIKAAAGVGKHHGHHGPHGHGPRLHGPQMRRLAHHDELPVD